ncbi:hypothetical protein ACXYN8_00695 [Altererythrobacter sp. CAU 1778]
MADASLLGGAISAMTGSQINTRFVELGPAGSGGAGASEAQANRFALSLDRASAPGGIAHGGLPAPVGKLLVALDGIDTQARSVADYARTAEASNGELTPGEIVQLTMKCQEFMFQCQLTSNIANRSADGVQQLFRQQG